jgi:NarL family two-component system response regulator LiaR
MNMQASRPIRVMLIDDHEMVRHGLSLMLQAYDDMLLVGEASDAINIVSHCRDLNPDVVLMDLMMPEIDGIQATQLLHQAMPQIRVIALTSFIDHKLVQKMLNAGAIGYLLKNASIDELAAAIRTAMQGKPILSSEATKALIEAANQPTPPGQDLTQREREVLKLMVTGLNNTQIAQALTVSRSTVKTHVSSILAKLGVASRVEAVRLAMQHDLVT